MSYDAAVAAMRAVKVEAPPFAEVEAAARWCQGASVPAAKTVFAVRWALRVAIVGFVAMGAVELAGAPSLREGGRMLAVSIPILTLVLANRLVGHRELGHQMLVRAFAWSALVIGVIVAGWDFSQYRATGIPIVVGAGTALMLLGTGGLGRRSRSFRPLAFRGHLLLALVMAFADAQTLGFAGVVQLGQAQGAESLYRVVVAAAPALGCGLVMAIVVWGIYRLRTWALILNVFANLGIAAASLHGYLAVTLPVAGALSVTAMIQLLLPLPILAAALGDRPRDRRPLGRVGPRLWRGGLCVTMALAVAMALVVPPGFEHGWAEQTFRAHGRGVAAGSGDLIAQDLRGEDFSGRDLARARIAGCRLESAVLRAADLRGASVSGTRLDGADLSVVNGEGAAFYGSSLVGADLRGARFFGAIFSDSDLRDADLRAADLRGISAPDTVFTGADLSGANLEGAVAPEIVGDLVNATCPDGTSAGALGECSGHWGRLSRAFVDRLGATTYVLVDPAGARTLLHLESDYLRLAGEAPLVARDDLHYFRVAPYRVALDLIVDGDAITAAHYVTAERSTTLRVVRSHSVSDPPERTR